MTTCSTCGRSAGGSYGVLGQAQCARCRDKTIGLAAGLQHHSIGEAAALIGPDDDPRRDGGGILAWIRRALGRQRRQ
ncbi:hypothetical protein [Nocardioides stalactiti]|uniref:hypothetical protein n=1 Tax=Nocardioides stalactiti TaxID=2755356 RepID=UPI0015FF06EF|nr:hypothetical protein [Nocardioides stalactiti]